MSFLRRLFGNEERVDNVDLKTNNESGDSIGCTQCGGLSYEHDSYFDDYICRNCGWSSKVVPKGVDKANIKKVQEVTTLVTEKVNVSEGKQPELIPQQNLADQLQVGMSLSEIIRILGPSRASIGGGEVVSMTQNIGTTMAGSLGKMMGGKTFMEWERPEGNYKLVIENDRLARIFSVPDKTVELGDVTIRVEEDMPDKNTKAKCDMCNDSFEENALLEVGTQDAITGQIKELKVCFKCHTKIVEQASGMYTR